MTALPLDSHIWVGASAGTGKTFTLTNRVLQLLLAGVSPPTILCLTYTNAAAAEMKLRVMQYLGKWVIAPEEELRVELAGLVEHTTDDVLKRARSLFFEISENPDSLNIQTIHGFCQSILRKFPLEAGVSPYFTVIDEERSQAIIEQALEQFLFELHQGHHPQLQEKVQALVLQMTDYSFREFIKRAISENSRWRAWLEQGLEPCKKQLQAFLDLSSTNDSTGFSQGNELAQLARYFANQSHKNLRQLAVEIESFLSLVDVSDSDVEDYCAAWLTTQNKLRQVIVKSMEQAGDMAPLIEQEAERVMQYRSDKAHQESYQLTSNLYDILDAILHSYESICQQQGYLDYHHLLQKTERFLKEDETALGWVMYKLDGGIDHVLVDEAQDTNPLQWNIIKAITVEYFSGQSRKEHMRTLFVVGDEKQSIFGFQDADLDVYRGIRQWLEVSARQANQAFHEEMLTQSYRSTPEVIDAVNNVVEQLEYNSPHVAHRKEQGKVAVWPLAEGGEYDDQIIGAPQALAQQIAAHVYEWLDEERVLASTGKPITPGDIMVLVRRRTGFSTQLASELRKCHIPVQGVERLVLRDSLAVQDILALLQWLLLPTDDYSLACVLRSPIGEISEEQLFELSAEREKATIWKRLQEQADRLGLKKQLAMLEQWQSHIQQQGVYAFLFSLYYEYDIANRFIKRMGQEVMIVLHALLEKAKQFEAIHPHNYQLFIEHIKEQHHEIVSKEVLEDCVRIMTIHGSKGLEAPVVILADTTDTTSNIAGFEWIEQSNTHIPCWLPATINRKDSLSQKLEQVQQKADAEDKRLLYVAMTRARDELYITGMEKKRTEKTVWYDILGQCLQKKEEKDTAVA